MALFGAWRWTRRRSRAEALTAVDMFKAGGKPGEKRTEDSAEDLGLEARGPSKVLPHHMPHGPSAHAGVQAPFGLAATCSP